MLALKGYTLSSIYNVTGFLIFQKQKKPIISANSAFCYVDYYLVLLKI